MSSKIDKWDFLFGNWESLQETHIGDPEGSLNKTKIQPFPSNKYIMNTNETWVGDELRYNSVQMIYYDDRADVYRCKAFFPFGFVVNYTSISTEDDRIVFKSEEVEAQPKDYDGTQFHYSIIKLTDNKFRQHLEMKAPGGDYFTFWNAEFEKI